MRHTKIVATLGPATRSVATLDALVDAGVDVFRLNFSHGSPDSHRTAIERVRATAHRAGRLVGVMQDLSGPKIRTGPLRGGGPVELSKGQPLTIVTGEFDGDAGRISTAADLLARAVRPGDRLLLDDGRLQLRVERVRGQEIETRVMDGGPLGEHKGITAPNVTLPSDAMTRKDVADLALGVELEVDLVAVSFVQSADDLHRVRDTLRGYGRIVPLIAKIERPQAVETLDAVLEASDGAMVARGDLGLELPFERVPRVQKQITRRARQLGVPVILATQVFDSMHSQPRPTRAEVSDAANAVDDGVDAIMLSGETAVGSYPVESVQTLDRVIREAEVDLPPFGVMPASSQGPEAWHGPSLCEAAVTLAAGGQAEAIVAVTRGGETARTLSSLRPRAPIFAATDDELIGRSLTLRWGVIPLIIDLSSDVDQIGATAERELVRRGWLAPGSVVVFVNVSADIAADGANFLTIRRLER